MKLQAIGIGDGVSFRVVNSSDFYRELNALKGRYRLTIEKYRRSKSNPQLRWLYGQVYPIVLKGLNDAGWEFTTIAEVDEYCKSMFASREVLNRHTGEIMTVPGLKRDMTTTEMMTYVDAIRDWASEYLNIKIPEPMQQMTMEL